MNKKRCSRCHQVKPLTEFYRHKNTYDGHTSECKVCNLARTKKYQATEQGKTAIKAYNQSERGKTVQKKARIKSNKTEKRKISNKRSDVKRRGTDKRRTSGNEASAHYRESHPNRVKARILVNLNVRKGILPHVTTLKCIDCGNNAEQYDHHKGYDKKNWLNIQPVCMKCHVTRHRK